jgi:hypothetical protein
VTSPSTNLTLAFPSPYGRFTILPDPVEPHLFILTIEESGTNEGQPRVLGRYRSISDAIVAVTKQETGFLKWDELSQEQIPRRVHDITSWEFE